MAVLVAGTAAGVASTLVARGPFSHNATLVLTQFVGVIVGSAALIVFLGTSDWSLSPVAAVVVMVLASGVPVVVAHAVTRAEAHAVSRAPSALPVAGIGVDMLGGVIGLAVLFGEALLVQRLVQKGKKTT